MGEVQILALPCPCALALPCYALVLLACPFGFCPPPSASRRTELMGTETKAEGRSTRVAQGA